MNCCSLSSYRITVHAGKRLVLYGNAKYRHEPRLLELGLGITAGTYDAERTADDWLIIPGHGGLPLRRTEGLHSFEDRLDQLIVRIERRQPDGSWVQLDELEYD